MVGAFEWGVLRGKLRALCAVIDIMIAVLDAKVVAEAARLGAGETVPAVPREQPLGGERWKLRALLQTVESLLLADVLPRTTAPGREIETTTAVETKPHATVPSAVPPAVPPVPPAVPPAAVETPPHATTSVSGASAVSPNGGMCCSKKAGVHPNPEPGGCSKNWICPGGPGKDLAAGAVPAPPSPAVESGEPTPDRTAEYSNLDIVVDHSHAFSRGGPPPRARSDSFYLSC